jgi:hypothetical protein
VRYVYERSGHVCHLRLIDVITCNEEKNVKILIANYDAFEIV